MWKLILRSLPPLRSFLLVGAFVLVAPARPSLAAPAPFGVPGELDPSFGSGGKVTTDVGASTFGVVAVAVQDDRKIVTAGYVYVAGSNDFALLRYNADGTLDASFGAGGKVTTDFAGRSDFAFAMALQPDGKIVVAGSAEDALTNERQFALTRYDTDGALDPSFGTGGKVMTLLASADGSEAEARAVAIQADGRILAGGWSWDGVDLGFALVRYNADGSLAPSFGSSGKAVTVFEGAYALAEAVALQSDGKIVAAGSALEAGTWEYRFALARYVASSPSAYGTFSHYNSPV